ncbi:probable serine/threonine-protein kinase MARK-A [Cynara cardunculus var. scolymus]|uniref:Uncharacterized protein n=1 Tax=Cynara cardunculus var. scolymus TaxID=59895 RepID=A0A103YBA9_CYNCS|nr:probable serine/threonine-protein kinase MARK-A [Cynara cardunculus var. scolymus]KVI05931.1 hypothetical protein Ccrd_015719 [Cynara cardunculus var. scolymus]
MVMGDGKRHNFKDHHQESNEHEQHHHHHQQQPCSSIEEASTISNGSSSSDDNNNNNTFSSSSSSSSSFDTADDDDASSSANSSRSSLYDLSDLMSQLPIKRGLSKFYHGKSDSFTSLARVTSIEDLPKKDKNPKSSSFRSHTLPKPIISKKISRKKKFPSKTRAL